MPGAAAKLILDHFPLSKLLDPEQLEPYAIPHELKPYQFRFQRTKLAVARLSFLDADLTPITLPTLAVDLCGEIAKLLLRYDACVTCPVRSNSPIDDEAVSTDCSAGFLRRTVSAIRTNGHLVGYVVGPDIPSEAFFERDLLPLPNGFGQDLLEHRSALLALDHELITRAVSRVARRLSRRCELERRLKILRHTRKRIVGACSEEDVVELAFSGMEAMFGKIDICLYMLNSDGRLHLVSARGPNSGVQPEIMPPYQGHVWVVIQSKRPWYGADLLVHPEGFVQAAHGIPALSAYTVPTHWGIDGKIAAVQVSSSVGNRFKRADQQSVWALVDMMSLAGVRIALAQERLTADIRQVNVGPWADCMIDAIAAPATNLVQILDAKQRLMEGVAAEARLQARSAAAAIRVFDANAQVLRFAACSGADWTDETKRIEYRRGELSAGMHALETEDEFFVPDTGREPREPYYRPILPRTRSVYAIPFRSRGQVIGVLSVDWAEPNDQNGPPRRSELRHLLHQFESVLETLESRESDIRRRLVATLGGGPTLNSEELATFGKETVTRTKAAFGARACSLFLVFPGQEDAQLVATTVTMPSQPIWYKPGEGFTGWVLENCRCLRLSDTADEEELRAIIPELKQHGKWSEDVEESGSQNSFLAAPMVVGDRVAGVIRLTVQNDCSGFTPEQETLLLQIAKELGQTVCDGWSQAKDRADATATAKEIQQLHLIGLGLADAPNEETVIQQVLATAITEATMKWGAVRLLNDAGDALELRAHQGFSGESLAESLRLSPLMSRALEASNAVYIPNARNNDEWKDLLGSVKKEHRDHLDRARTVLLVPIRLKGKALGVVLLKSPDSITVSERVLGFLTILGGYAAVTITLAKAKKQLQDELNAARPLATVGTFAAGFLHQVANRLQGCYTALSNLAAGIFDIGTFDARIRKDLDLLSAVCEELRLFAPESGQGVRMEYVPLAKLVEEAIEGYHLPAKTRIEPALDWTALVQCSPTFLQGAFISILNNAVEAMPEGGVIKVAMSSGGGRSCVTFADSGVGMDPKTNQRSLEPFFTTKEAPGHGLGLAGVDRVMAAHGGKINIKSELGKGTTVMLDFPAKDV